MSPPRTTDQERRRERIIQITCQLVESMVLKGELDPDDDEALKKATRAAANTARAAYNAAEEYLCG